MRNGHNVFSSLVSMLSLGGFAGTSRTDQEGRCSKMIENLEGRRLFANGISPNAGPQLNGSPGVELSNVVVADFTITDPSGSPGNMWNAKVSWGDGGTDLHVQPIAQSDGSFDFIDSHTYGSAGDYTITTQIAVPGSHDPTANTVTENAVISVPEPSTLAIVSLGAFAMLRRTRKFELKQNLFGTRKVRIPN
jgi:hypothetical protein